MARPTPLAGARRPAFPLSNGSRVRPASADRGGCWSADPLERRVLLAAQLVADLIPGPAGGMEVSELYDVGGTLFFTATSQGQSTLWRTDGTAAGTRMLAPIELLGDYPGDARWHRAAIGKTLYFTSGREFWKSNGTPEGTVLVKGDFPPEAVPRGLTSYRDRVFFFPNDYPYEEEGVLWSTDGTAAGTKPFGADWTKVNGIGVAGETLYFVQYKMPSGEWTGWWNWELWGGDGTAAGTSLLTEVVDSGPLWSPHLLTAVGDELFFVADYHIWQSDGTPAGTHMVIDLAGNNFSFPEWLSDFNGRLVFSSGWFRFDREGAEPWISDGTAAGTRLLKDIAPGGASSWPAYFAVSGDRVYFQATDARGAELWRSDGTPAGTTIVRDLYPGAAGSTPTDLTTLGDSVYFTAYDPLRGGALWKTNDRGTDFVADVAPGTGSSRPTQLTTSGGALYFVADDGVHGLELWRYDEDVPVASLAGGQLTIRGTAMSDRITLDYAAGALRATMNGRVQSWPAAAVSKVRVDALDGTDVVDCDPLAVPVTVNGGTGNDTITGGNAGGFLRGEGGNDLIRGGQGKDRIEGNAGHDFIIGGASNDLLAGGSGNDRIEGNSGNDEIYGEAGADAIWGGSGDDFVNGGSENDTLNGEVGRDVLFGASGNDRLLARDGWGDVADGGDGYDSARVDLLLDAWADVERLLD